jgi:hypothetical protein
MAEGTHGKIEKSIHLIVFLPAEFIGFHLVLWELVKCSKTFNIWNVFGFSHISLLLHS